MNQPEILQLSSAPLSLGLAPSIGGSIANFEFVREGEKFSIFRNSGGVPRTVLDAASFPLVPYSNRIRGGRFSFRGREVALTPNMKSDPSPLHGQGWLGGWGVVQAGENHAELRYRHEADEWPWTYEARQHFALDASGLTIRLACTNLSDDAMPCGLGQHPYFPCTPRTRLDTRVEGAWTIDERVLPVERVPATGRFDLTDRPVCGQDLDHGFDGWSGSARIETPGLPFAIEIRSATAGCFQLYSPKEGGLFVAEPVTHTNAALNEAEERWPELGLRVLEPGEGMVLESRFEIVPA